jgi:CHAT domain-containing protein
LLYTENNQVPRLIIVQIEYVLTVIHNLQFVFALFLTMIRFSLVLLLLAFATTISAQTQFPSLKLNIDSLFDICSSETVTDNEKARLLSQVDRSLEDVEASYPLFRGMIYLYEAYHSPGGMMRTAYHDKGIELISNHKRLLADSFAFQCYQLLGYYSWSNRMAEWLPADKLLRSVVSAQENDDEWCILSYANKKMNEGHYTLAEHLASYDLLYSKKMYPATADYQLSRVYDEWIALNSRYKSWLAVPYYDRNEKFTLKQEFRNLLRHLGTLRDSVITNNSYGSKHLKLYQRTLYYRIYKELVLAYAGWSINDHREGQAILPLKNFLLQDLIPNEMQAAMNANVFPVISCAELGDLYSKLTELYINTGNGKEASGVAKNGIDFISNYKQCHDNDISRAITYLHYLRTKAGRVEGKYETSLKRNDLLKKWWPLPKSTSPDSINQWNWYIEARLQEVYTLIAQHKNDAAGDSLTFLVDKLSPIENDSVHLLSKSYQWPQLQFASMQYMARRGKWQVVRDYLLDALTIVEQDNHWENVPYYYDMQLLYLVAEYRTTGKLLKHVVANMLFYTGRQLQHTFFMLTPEDRIRLYGQKLSLYFDVYHELLLTKLLDDEPSLKERIIAQSLHLKNALVDANIFPNEFLGSNPELLQYVEEIRASRSRSNLLLSRLKMRKQDEVDLSFSEGAQSLWLTLLENANLDSLVTFTGWKKIASALKPGQVYVEAVRYTNWLTDSASTYSAYIIKDGKLDIIKLFNEGQVLKLLKDPSASPQSGVLLSNNTRGLSVGKQTLQKKFQKGAEDKLGTLMLSPLMPFISAKKELLIVADGLLNRISLAALEWKHKSLFSYIQLRQLSGSYILRQAEKSFPTNGKALIAGGLNYGQLKEGVNVNRLLNKNYSWQYLPATKKEVENLQQVFETAGQQVTLLTGDSFPDSLRPHLSRYNLIHLATHGFYIDSPTARTFFDRTWSTEAIRNDPMMRCGIATSAANFPDPKGIESEGHLMGFELANTDLRNCYLVSLSACETGLGDLRNNLGVDGLSRALKLGGAKFLLISLWKVPDEPTAVFMQQFYKELFRLKDPAAALRSAQAFMNNQYDVADWAAFVLVE